MSLNFGSSLFPNRGRTNIGYDFSDILRGNSYVQFFGGKTEGVSTQGVINEATVAGAETINSNSKTTAQTFTVTQETFILTSVELDLNFVNQDETPGTAVVNIKATDSSGDPTGSSLATASVVISSDGWKTFTLDQSVPMTIGEIFAIEVSGVVLGADFFSWNYSTGDAYDGGVGYVNDVEQSGRDYRFRTNGRSSNPYTLFSKRFDSQPEQEVGVNNLEFDIVVNTPSTIKGYALLNMNATGQTDIKAEVFHTRGGIETSLGSETAITGPTRNALGINLTEQRFLKGDILRLKLSSATGTFTIDYSDNDNSTEKNLIIWVPFDIQT